MKQILQKIEGLKRIADFLRERDDYIIISHISPDGDTLGSGLALYTVLKLYNKRVQMVCGDRVPYSLSFLPNADEVLMPDKAVHAENVIAVDCADTGRLGKALSLFENAKNTVNIDHHGTNTNYAMHNEVHPYCASNSEIVYELIRLFAGTCPTDAATCLYTGVMTDTGSFAFSNTTANTFLTAAELVSLGADPCMCNTYVYRTVPQAKSRLLGKALSSIQYYGDGKIGVCVITQQDIALCKAHADDTEGIIDHVRDIESVEVAVFIRECQDGDYKVGLRSKSEVDVSLIAQNFGGGGHVRASGFKIKMKYETLFGMLIDAIEDALYGDGN